MASCRDSRCLSPRCSRTDRSRAARPRLTCFAVARSCGAATVTSLSVAVSRAPLPDIEAFGYAQSGASGDERLMVDACSEPCEPQPPPISRAAKR
jgi:hypothetical protein